MNSRRLIVAPKSEAKITNAIYHIQAAKVRRESRRELAEGMARRASCWHVGFTSISGLPGSPPALLGRATSRHATDRSGSGNFWAVVQSSLNLFQPRHFCHKQFVSPDTRYNHPD